MKLNLLLAFCLAVTISSGSLVCQAAPAELASSGSDLPKLSIQKAAGNFVLSWPAAHSNFKLETAQGSARPLLWGALPKPAVTNGDQLTVTISPSSKVTFFRLNTMPAAPWQPAPLDLPGDWQPTFPVLAQTQALVPSSGSENVIALPNGARMQIPAGAFATDTRVTITNVDIGEFSGGIPRDVYHIDLSGAPLLKAVTLLLPFPKGSDPARPFHVLRTSPEGTEELAFQTDLVQHQIQVAVDHFSDIVVEQEAELPNPAGGADSKLLAVPYYPQGSTMWCYAAACQMLGKYYGADFEAWDVARFFKVTLDDGPTPLRLYSGNYAAFFDGRGLKVREHRAWVLGGSIDAYLKQEIDANRPVFVIVQYGAHAVVVVGYDSTGVFLHDPSGHSLQEAGVQFDSSQLAARHLTWEQWNTAMFKQKLLKVPFNIHMPVWTLTIDGTPAVAPSVATVSQLSAEVAGTSIFNAFLEGHRPDPPSAQFIFNFLWNGKQDHGYEFRPSRPVDPVTLSLSDTLVWWVQLNNGGSVDAPVTVEASLDDTPVLANPISTVIPAGKTVVQTILFSEQNPLKFASKSQDLAPGDHYLGVALKDAANNVLDSFQIFLKLGPSQPSGVKKRKIDGGVAVSWDPNPEAANAGIEYLVYDNDTLIGTTSSLQLVQSTGSDQDTYTVVARDIKSQLESPKSLPAQLDDSTRLLLTRQQATFRFSPSTILPWTPVGFNGNPPVLTLAGWLASGLTAGPGEEVTATNVSFTVTSGKTSETLKLSWPEPPATLSTNDTFNFPITAEVSGDLPYTSIRAQGIAHYGNSSGATSVKVGTRAVAGFALVPGTNDTKPNPVSSTSTFSASVPVSTAITTLQYFEVTIDGVSGALQASVRWYYSSPPP